MEPIFTRITVDLDGAATVIELTEFQWNTMLTCVEDNSINPQAEPQCTELWEYIQGILNG